MAKESIAPNGMFEFSKPQPKKSDLFEWEAWFKTYAAGYAFARDIDERGASKKGPYRGDNIPEPILVGLLTACGYEPDPAVYWQGYCDYWYDRGITEYGW